MGNKSLPDPDEREALIHDVAEAKDWTSESLSNWCLDELKRITGLGKTDIRKSIAEAQAASPGGGKETAADILIRLGRESELWKSTDPRPEHFATVEHGGNQKHLRLKGSDYKHYLAGKFFDATGKAPSGEALEQALVMLTSARAGRARRTSRSCVSRGTATVCIWISRTSNAMWSR